jgi:xylose isomerase
MALTRSSLADLNELKPRPEHKFTFGLWTVGHPGHDGFGMPTRPKLELDYVLDRLAQIGVWGVSFHDDDVVPAGSSATERRSALQRFRNSLSASGLVASMAGCNLFWHPVFKDGAFLASDPAIRRHALAKAIRAIDMAAELEVPIFVLWGGREGTEAMAAKPPLSAIERYREAIEFLCGYVDDRGYQLRFAIEPKPNEPRGDAFLPTVGHALAFIDSLVHSEMVGVNVEFAHETMVGLSFTHALAYAISRRKLFHVDLNGQKGIRFDQDLRFGAEGLQEAFYAVKLLEESGYDGPRQFDARPYRVDSAEGIWQFAAGCMRTYLALAEKARRFASDPEIAQALKEAGVPRLSMPAVNGYSRAEAETLLNERLDLDLAGNRDYGHERLDQLVVDLLLGLR